MDPNRPEDHIKVSFMSAKEYKMLNGHIETMSPAGGVPTSHGQSAAVKSH